MKRRVVALGSLFLLIVSSAFPSFVSAGVVFQDTTCTQYLVSNAVCIFEDSNGNGDNVLISQQGNVADLSTVRVTTGDHGCAYFPFYERSSWNDCISSIRIVLTAGHSFCLYHDKDYSPVVGWLQPFRYVGPLNATLRNFGWGPGGGGMNDEISSIKWGC